jgi:PHD/YefM family antitoxin component YafN of YafNO toxin-antitoxin module
MPMIRKSADLRNHYNEISDFCHKMRQTVFITKHGDGDLAVMSMDEYNRKFARYELYDELQKGMDDIEAGRVLTLEEVKANMLKVLGKHVQS